MSPIEAGWFGGLGSRFGLRPGPLERGKGRPGRNGGTGPRGSELPQPRHIPSPVSEWFAYADIMAIW